MKILNTLRPSTLNKIFLESMMVNHYLARAEIKDIYSAFDLQTKHIFLPTETAFVKYFVESINLISRIYNIFKKNHKNLCFAK